MTESPDVLTDGSWQTVQGVRRWVPRQWAPPVRPERDVRLLVACPTCRAKVHQTCRTRGGNPTTPHGTRLAPRLCPCGARVAPGRQVCEPCRYTARQETYLAREKRRATSQRRTPGYMQKWREENRDHLQQYRAGRREKDREYLRQWRAKKRAEVAA